MVFWDVDTQADFMLPGGKLYVPGAETLLPLLRRLREFAAQQHVPLVSTADAHATDDPEFRQWPPHCIRGTAGQLKVPETLGDHYLVVPRERQAQLTDEELARYPQFILEKNMLDVFTSPQTDDLVKRLDAERYIVYGVATEYCVRCAVLGLLERKQRVAVLRDAIREIDALEGRIVLDELVAHGAQLITSSAVLAVARVEQAQPQPR
jgi:nicotinamidase/pyrazinamidase